MDNKPLNAETILQSYGGVNQNMLENLTDAYEHDENEISAIHHSPYYSADSLPNFLHSKNGNFNILSLNVCSLLSKIDSLKIYLEIIQKQGISFDVITLQETWLDDSYSSSTASIQLDGYNCIPQGKKCGQKGGLVTYIRNEYDSLKVDVSQNSVLWECLFVSVTHKNTDSHLIIGNVYKPPRNNNNNTNIECFIKELDPILESLSKRSCDLCLTGDYNIDLLKICQRSKFTDFFDKMLSHSLYPKITFPTRISSHSCTLIDNIYCKLSNNTINSEAGIIFSDISDHFPQFVSLKLQHKKSKSPPKLTKQKINCSKAINNLKIELMNNELYQGLVMDLNVDPNINYDNLIEIITKAKNKHLPTRLVKFNKHKHKKSKWITYGIIKSITFRDDLHLKLKRMVPSLPEYDIVKTNLKTYNSILKKSIQQAKVLYYGSIFEQYKNDIKNTWKNISLLISKSNKKEINQITVNGTKIKDKLAMANEFNIYFANIGHKLAETIDTTHKKPFNSYLRNKNIMTTFHFNLLNTEDTHKIVKSLKTKTSVGHDGISVKLLKDIIPGLLQPLTLILNQSIMTGIFPDSLKIAKVIPLYKKDNPEEVGNYRPVSLLCAISKIFEKVAYNQLYNYFKQNKLFYDCQYGFRDEHSTELTSLELIDRILLDLDKKKNPVTVYMDLSKAFDTLDHKILLHKLKFYGINGLELAWFNSYLSDRVQYVEIGNAKSSYMPLNTGVPQGSIIGPLLFLIYMNDIPESTTYFDFILYADDTSLKSFINTKDPYYLKTNSSAIINLELSKVNDWLCVNKLSLNVKKTKFMIFHTPQQKIESFIPELKIGDTKIEKVVNFNFLGLTLNENLSWKPHVDRIANKISKYIGILNRLKRYLPCHILKTIYFSLVHSNINYSLLAWGFNCGRLKTLQKKAIRIITNSKYNAHTEPLMKTLEILKLEDLFKLNILKWYYRFINLKLPAYFLKYQIRLQADIHSHDTRFNTTATQPVPRIHAARYCLRNHVSVVLNSIPNNVLEKVRSHSYKGFSSYAKGYLLSTYSLECNIENCYICSN